ncbi:MAG: DUF342 domain-containing protein [Deltaproteobacteria bacterium]|nr:DUF342 domain-containing protein [Deltaproteobacteria bacterium]
MESEGKAITSCPSCRKKYRVPEFLEGRTVACKKCGESFNVAFTESAHAAEHPGSGQEAFDVSVSDDQLEAFILPKIDTFSTITVDDIKLKLKEFNITYGILDDEQIEAFLEDGPYARMPFKVAQGKVPAPDTDEPLQLYFPARRLEEVASAEMAAADSEERPMIPRVKQGDLIAQWVVPIEGYEGVNVFGEPVVLSGFRGSRIPHGPGTETSVDGLRLFADIDGIPNVTIDGRIRVLPELRIPGDVNSKTGPVQFDGYIVVKGEVRDGLSIRGGMLVAGEIQKAEIDVEGDVVVTGGIIGGRLRAGGNVRAKFVKNAAIRALGDVVVQKEIHGSRITACGRVTTEQGKILSSRISAKKGIKAVDIGSVPSTPCLLSVGIDEITEQETKRIRTLMSEKDEWIHGLRSMLTRLEQQAVTLKRKMAGTSTALMEGKADLALVEEKLAQARRDEQPLNVARLEKVAAELDTKIIQTGKTLENLGQDREQLIERIDDRQEELAHSEKALEDLEAQYESMLDWSAAQPAHPEIMVSGVIVARTSVQGPHASAVLVKNERNVLIRETNISGSAFSDEWSFWISPLR